MNVKRILIVEIVIKIMDLIDSKINNEGKIKFNEKYY